MLFHLSKHTKAHTKKQQTTLWLKYEKTQLLSFKVIKGFKESPRSFNCCSWWRRKNYRLWDCYYSKVVKGKGEKQLFFLLFLYTPVTSDVKDKAMKCVQLVRARLGPRVPGSQCELNLARFRGQIRPKLVMFKRLFNVPVPSVI